MERRAYRDVRATEFIRAGDDRIVVGIHWIADDGSERESVLYQSVRIEGGRIRHIQDYRDRRQALRGRRQPVVSAPVRDSTPGRRMASIVGVEPIFMVSDAARATDHYRRLGFAMSHHDESYAFAHRDRLTIHLAQTESGPMLAGSLYMHVDDADDLAAEWRAAGVDVVGPEDFDYGKREGRHTDPDGNLIRFGSPLRR
jgi:uncharacterized glyoxalase superfamily protein PhnB